MQKGQGSLEYLIIVAAVLAIAAIVVLFLTGAFQGQQGAGDISKCKVSAATCNNELATSNGQATCSYCTSSCAGAAVGFVDTCKQGLADQIFA